MRVRYKWVAVVFLALVSPILAFPDGLGAPHGWMAAIVAIVALLGAVGLVSDYGHLPRYVGLVAVTSLIGWVAATNEASTINHFGGLALGLFAMGTVAVWCRTRERLIAATVLFLLGGALALGVGSRSIPPVHPDKAIFGETTRTEAPVRPLPLAVLHSRTAVNRNALAATAMLILPVALAVALSPSRWRGLRGAVRWLGLLTALWAGVVVVMMQSRSAWLSAVVVLWIWAGGRSPSRRWWLVTGFAVLASTAALYFVWSGHSRLAEAAATLHARVAIWEQGLQALRPSPLFGIGFDYFRHSGYSPILAWPDATAGRVHAHNLFLQTALDIGLVGLAGYLAVIGYVMRRALETVRANTSDPWVRRMAAGAALSVVSVHVYGVFDAVSLGAKVGIFQWISCGLVLAISRMQPRPDQD